MSDMQAELSAEPSAGPGDPGGPDFDAVVIGAGFAGLYMVYRLRELGFSVLGLEAGSGVGGTWYWNRYPGARCDSESTYYSYSFLPDFEQEWPLIDRYPTQPVILRYLEAVADHLDLLKDFTFGTRVTGLAWDDETGLWTVRSAGGPVAKARIVVAAVGALSAANVPQFPGAADFAGEQYSTARWPHTPPSFAGQRVGLIGTGSSGVQVLPELAKQARTVTVFQRTAQFVTPAGQGPLDPQLVALWKANYQEIRRRTKLTPGGIPIPEARHAARDLSEAERSAVCEEAWRRGGIWFLDGTFTDAVTDLASNQVVADFVRAKISEIVRDQEVAEKLKPRGYPWGTKRVPIGTNYYESFNLPNVRLVDLRADPIERLTRSGIRTGSGEHELDAIVYATGFDALTGSILALNATGRSRRSLTDAWSGGPHTYLGLMIPGFPNLFTITGPGSPGVLTNVPVAIEQHVEWIADAVAHLRDRGFAAMEAELDAAAEWTKHVQEIAGATLFPTADSWYMGANIPGKPRVFLPYLGGLGVYRKKCDAIAADGYRGFTFEPAVLAGQEVISGSG
ncbi:MAG TPA: NAD(P)/FAD-dependent oxidoreductase [Streptosporangiaceae bacterium]|nr:NAD(P)/FAD-dependent oxidoreductase [Streptosporangiaceae bacterium]